MRECCRGLRIVRVRVGDWVVLERAEVVNGGLEGWVREKMVDWVPA